MFPRCQRLDGALNLNVHLHALVLEGVFTNDDGTVRFHPVPRQTREDVAEVVALVALIACMRTLLTILNAMMRTNTTWKPITEPENA